MSRATRRLLISSALSLLLVVPALLAVGALRRQAALAPPAAPLPDLGPAPAFALTDQSGQPVTLEDLKGQVWAADFFFTSCPGICPILSANMQQLHADLADHPEPGAVRLVSFSLDPETDTVAHLAEYADALGATPDRWLMLTGPRQAIWSLSSLGFKLAVSDTPDDPVNPISHTGKIVLVDRGGTIRGYYDGLSPQGMADLQRDLRRLIDRTH